MYFLQIECVPEGFIRTCTIRHNKNTTTAEIELVIEKLSLHGRGLGTKVIGLLIHFWCHELGVRKVTAGLYAFNGGSLKVSQEINSSSNVN